MRSKLFAVAPLCALVKTVYQGLRHGKKEIPILNLPPPYTNRIHNKPQDTPTAKSEMFFLGGHDGLPDIAIAVDFWLIGAVPL